MTEVATGAARDVAEAQAPSGPSASGEADADSASYEEEDADARSDMGEARAPAPSVREDETDETAATTAPSPDEAAGAKNTVDETNQSVSAPDAPVLASANDNTPAEDLPTTGTDGQRHQNPTDGSTPLPIGRALFCTREPLDARNACVKPPEF